MPLKRASGFTLLEVMVVLAIIGGLVSMATFSFSSNKARDETLQHGRQVVAYLSALREEAIFQNVDLGLHFDREHALLVHYRVEPIDEQKSSKDDAGEPDEEQSSWVAYSVSYLKDELLFSEPIGFRLISDDQEIELGADSDAQEDEALTPALLFLSADEYTPFELQLLHEEDRNVLVRIVGDGLNAIELEDASRDE